MILRLKKGCFCGFLVCLFIYFKNKTDTELEVGGLLLTLGLVRFFPLLSLTVAVPSSLLLPPSCGRQRLSTFVPDLNLFFVFSASQGTLIHPPVYSQSEFWEVLENPDTQVCTHKLFPVIIGRVGFFSPPRKELKPLTYG